MWITLGGNRQLLLKRLEDGVVIGISQHLYESSLDYPLLSFQIVSIKYVDYLDTSRILNKLIDKHFGKRWSTKQQWQLQRKAQTAARQSHMSSVQSASDRLLIHLDMLPCDSFHLFRHF